MNPKLDALMLQNFHGELAADPELAGLFGVQARPNGMFDFLSKAPSFTRTLQVGKTGDDVKYMQKMLGIPQTGVFDESMAQAVASATGMTDPFSSKFGVIDLAAWNLIKSGGKKAKTAQTASDVLAIGGSIFDALRAPPMAPSAAPVPVEEETNWLLYGGVALPYLAVAGVALVVVGGGIYLLTRD